MRCHHFCAFVLGSGIFGKVFCHIVPRSIKYSLWPMLLHSTETCYSEHHEHFEVELEWLYCTAANILSPWKYLVVTMVMCVFQLWWWCSCCGIWSAWCICHRCSPSTSATYTSPRPHPSPGPAVPTPGIPTAVRRSYLSVRGRSGMAQAMITGTTHVTMGRGINKWLEVFTVSTGVIHVIVIVDNIVIAGTCITIRLQVQSNLFRETTAIRDHLSWKTTCFWHTDLHFSITEPVTRAYLSWKTTFLWPMRWSFKTGSTCSVAL